MEYTIRVPEVMGDVFFLYSVAETMAKKAASAGDKGFHQAAYKPMLLRYIGDLVLEAQEGRLKVCNQTGAIRTPDEIVAEAKGKPGLVSRLTDTNETVALNVCVSLRQLNIWAHERGNVFQITREGVPWVDERGWNNGDMKLTMDVLPVSDEHLGTPKETLLQQGDASLNPIADSEALRKAAPVEVLANFKRWTPDFIAKVEAYREKFGTKKAAVYFQFSESLIRRKLPGKKPPSKGYSAFTQRPK